MGTNQEDAGGGGNSSEEEGSGEEIVDLENSAIEEAIDSFHQYKKYVDILDDEGIPSR